MTNPQTQYKAWMVDFDGTLANPDLEVSSRVKTSINKLAESGVIFSIATGRPFQGIVRTVCQHLNLINPQIIKGGSEIIDPKTEKILWSEYIDTETAKQLVDFLIKINIVFAVESGLLIYTPGKIELPGYGPGIEFRDIQELDYDKVSQIVPVISDLPDTEEFEQQLKADYPNLHIVKSGIKQIKVLNITSIRATKHLGVLKLSEILGIDPKQVIGIGNGYNDYPLLTACGYKIAMGDSPEELKEIADLVVPDSLKDGLAVAINNFL